MLHPCEESQHDYIKIHLPCPVWNAPRFKQQCFPWVSTPRPRCERQWNGNIPPILSIMKITSIMIVSVYSYPLLVASFFALTLLHCIAVSCHCPYFPLSARFSHFAFSRVIWTLNYTTKILLLYYLFSTLSGEAIGVK